MGYLREGDHLVVVAVNQLGRSAGKSPLHFMS